MQQQQKNYNPRNSSSFLQHSKTAAAVQQCREIASRGQQWTFKQRCCSAQDCQQSKNWSFVFWLLNYYYFFCRASNTSFRKKNRLCHIVGEFISSQIKHYTDCIFFYSTCQTYHVSEPPLARCLHVLAVHFSFYN